MLQNSPMYSYLPATDVARARQFYEEKLGFKPGRLPLPHAERRHVEGGVAVENYPGSKDGVMTAGGAKAAWFKDSEGNILALVQGV
jgi:predicted enzyme related to lactoylglutathione lyase